VTDSVMSAPRVVVQLIERYPHELVHALATAVLLYSTRRCHELDIGRRAAFAEDRARFSGTVGGTAATAGCTVAWRHASIRDASPIWLVVNTHPIAISRTDADHKAAKQRPIERAVGRVLVVARELWAEFTRLQGIPGGPRHAPFLQFASVRLFCRCVTDRRGRSAHVVSSVAREA
jgi:hypothetical protein